jgi:hypothetical protein
MAKLDSLIVDMQLNSAQLRAGLDQVNSKLDGFGKKLNDLAGVITFEKIGRMAFEAAEKMAHFVMAGAEAADKMGKLSQSAGVSVETLSKLDYAAGLSGLSTEDLGQAFNHLNINIAKAGAGSREQAVVFQALGVHVKTAGGKVRDSAALMADIADRFSDLKDGASKSALAVEIFGKAGAAMVPFLNQGKDGLAELGAEADRLGITITAGAAASAEQFNDNLEKLDRAGKAVGQRVAAELTPAMVKLTDELLNSKTGATLLEGAAKALAVTLKLLVSAGVIVGAIFEAVGHGLARVASALVNVAAGRFREAWTDLKGVVEDRSAAVEDAVGRLKAVWEDAGDAATKSADKQSHAAKKSADAIMRAVELAKNAKAKDFLHFDWETPNLAMSVPLVQADRPSINGYEADPEHVRMVSEYQARQQKEEMKRLNDQESFTGKMKAGLNRIGESLSESVSALGSALKAQAPKLLSNMGSFGQVAQSGMEGFTTGGPWGAFLAIIVDIVTRLTSFQKLVDSFNGRFDKILGQIDKVVAPFFDVIDQLAGVFDGLLSTFQGDMMNALKYALWLLGKSFIGLAIVTVEIAKWFSDITGNHDQGLADAKKSLAKAWAQPFDAVTAPVKKMGDAAEKTANALNELQTNLPSGYKVRSGQLAADMGLGGWNTPGGGSSSSDPGIAYNSSGTSVGQDQTSESTKAPTEGGSTKMVGGAGIQYGTAAWAAQALSPQDFALWLTFFTGGMQGGMSISDAEAYATQLYLAVKNSTTGSSAQAATAAGGVTNIGAPGKGISSVGGGGAAGVGGGTTQIFNIAELRLFPSDLFDLARQLQDLWSQQTAGKYRNSAKTIK